MLFIHALGISLPHTIDILLYAHDASINTKPYAVRRFIIAVHGMRRNSLDCTHSATDFEAINGKSEL